MSIAGEVEKLLLDKNIPSQLAGFQKNQRFQQEYSKMIQEGIIQKRSYSLAPVNVLGASIPGQTTYQVDL